MVKKKKFRIPRELAPAATIAIGTIGAGIIGDAMPGTSGAGLKTMSSTMGKFIAPMTTIGMGGMVMRQANRTFTIKRRKKKK